VAEALRVDMGSETALPPSASAYLGHNNVIVGSGVLHTHLRRRWGPADALLHGVQETCARSRAGLGQILAPRTVFSHREPFKIG
jgi:hypothetical protein